MPSKSYLAQEATTIWTDSGGDKLMDMGGLAPHTDGTTSTGVVCGAYLDLGAAPRADIFEVEVFLEAFSSGTAVVGQTLDLFFIQSNDSTTFDGRPTTAPTSSAQGTITGNQARNATYAGSIVVFSDTEADNLMQNRFVVRLTGRYVAPVLINRTGGTLASSSDDHEIRLTPIPQESQ